MALIAGTGGAWAGADEAKRVAGKVVLEHSICRGGAAITREDMERLPPPQPIAGRAFLVVAGDRIRAKKAVARFTTRADGTFVTHLPPGTWCFFEAGRRPEVGTAPAAAAPTSAGIDADCLAEQKRRCDLVLAVKSDVRAAQIVFRERCPQPWAQPCYHGPMPP